MTSPQDPQRDQEVAPLGGAVSEPDGDDSDTIAGPVYPPPETEPDAQ
jgi:hypothetical protein